MGAGHRLPTNRQRAKRNQRSRQTTLTFKIIFAKETVRYPFRPPASNIHYPEIASTPEPKGGARCVSSARRDLHGGRGETCVPTVTSSPALCLPLFRRVPVPLQPPLRPEVDVLATGIRLRQRSPTAICKRSCCVRGWVIRHKRLPRETSKPFIGDYRPRVRHRLSLTVEPPCQPYFHVEHHKRVGHDLPSKLRCLRYETSYLDLKPVASFIFRRQKNLRAIAPCFVKYPCYKHKLRKSFSHFILGHLG